VGYAVHRSVEQDPDRTVAVLARRWADLDGVRDVLDREGVDFIVHSRGFHQPLHRRHPCARFISHVRALPGGLDVAAERLCRETLESWDRSSDEPVVLEIRKVLSQLDDERRRPSGRLDATTGPEIADALLMASREMALRAEGSVGRTAVHLCTFHGAKGLEFDKVIVMPSPMRGGAGTTEERRLYYVAMTRARSELILATHGEPGELAREVDAPELRLDEKAARLAPAEVSFMDCTPADVLLGGPWLGRAQAIISRLCEGDELLVGCTETAVSFLHKGRFIGHLSRAGLSRFRRLASRTVPSPRLAATVRDVWVHLDRDSDGTIRRRSLIPLPTLRLGR
jgi:hypothetical protein